jgi:hypothetical protein
MQILKYLIWGLSTREGRDEFFGPSKANEAHYRHSSAMRQRFEAEHPEVKTYGSMDNFIGAYQWSDSDRSYCYLIPEDETFSEAERFLRSRAHGSELHLWMRDELDIEIPLLLTSQLRKKISL